MQDPAVDLCKYTEENIPRVFNNVDFLIQIN